MNPDFIPEVVQVIPQSNKTVVVYFLTGHIRLFDASPLCKKGGVFQRLEDESFFKDRCTVLNGTLAWDVTGNRDETQCLDVDPFVLWNASYDIDEPEPLKSLGETLVIPHSPLV